MTPFFRRIRQKLANDNQFLKYSRYAIGEIALVVIGILIALQINNWNEERKGKLLANQFAEALVRDLTRDTVSLKSAIKFHEERSIGLETLISFKDKDLNQTSVNDSMYIFFRAHCLNIGIFENNKSTLTQLKSADELVLFNEKTKDSIVSLEMANKQIFSQSSFYRSAYENNRNISKKILDYTAFFDPTFFKNRVYTGKKVFPKGNYSNKLTRELFNELSLLRGTSALYLRGLQFQLKKTENLIQLLRLEYKL